MSVQINCNLSEPSCHVPNGFQVAVFSLSFAERCPSCITVGDDSKDRQFARVGLLLLDWPCGCLGSLFNVLEIQQLAGLEPWAIIVDRVDM
ncbi:hypothetical protein VTO42DRAFT_3302 [Malbranchea cinnamomea]